MSKIKSMWRKLKKGWSKFKAFLGKIKNGLSKVPAPIFGIILVMIIFGGIAIYDIFFAPRIVRVNLGMPFVEGYYIVPRDMSEEEAREHVIRKVCKDLHLKGC